MEYAGKGRQSICTWRHHLTHHIDGDSACLTQCHLYAATAVTCAESALQSGICLMYCQSCNIDRSEAFYCNVAIRAYGIDFRFLGCSIDIHLHLIARTHHIILRSGNVHYRFEGKVFTIEDISSEHLTTMIERFSIGVFVHRIIFKSEALKFRSYSFVFLIIGIHIHLIEIAIAVRTIFVTGIVAGFLIIPTLVLCESGAFLRVTIVLSKRIFRL